MSVRYVGVLIGDETIPVDIVKLLSCPRGQIYGSEKKYGERDEPFSADPCISEKSPLRAEGMGKSREEGAEGACRHKKILIDDARGPEHAEKFVIRAGKRRRMDKKKNAQNAAEPGRGGSNMQNTQNKLSLFSEVHD